jgi:hypothetical protein
MLKRSHVTLAIGAATLLASAGSSPSFAWDARYHCPLLQCPPSPPPGPPKRDHRKYPDGVPGANQGGVGVSAPPGPGHGLPQRQVTHVSPAPNVAHPTNWQGQNARDHRGEHK